MNMLRKLPIIIGGILVVALLGLSYGVHRYAAQEIVNRIPTQINRYLPPFIKLNYANLKADNCILSLCLSAQDVTVSLPGNEVGKTVTFNLGDVSFERGLTGVYHVVAKSVKGQDPLASEVPIQVDFDAAGTVNNGTVNKLSFQQNQFSAQLSGTIDRKTQSVNLQGDAVGLSQFVNQFVPPDLQFITSFLLQDNLQDKSQKISITTNDEWILFMDIPIIPKKNIFQP